MPDITYADRDPQDTDSALDIKLKTVLTVLACVEAQTGAPAATAKPQTTDSYAQLEIKLLTALRELEAAL
ncbi:MAG TPA: hypothetical protein VM680_18605 [Verrucomicrobiae bacterium]|nr:hypothetical protein [Verrucomicrobiae bacterium]